MMAQGLMPAAVAGLVMWAGPGCRPREAASAHSAGATPIETVALIHEARRAGRIAEVDRWLVPADRGLHVPIILALDRAMSENAALQEVMRERFGAGVASACDLSEMGDSYGVFSMHVRIVSEQRDGDRATVLIQEGQSLPLVGVSLVRTAAGWLADVEEPEAGLEEGLARLARALESVRRQAERSAATSESVGKAFRSLVWPVVMEIGASGGED